ncbi:MAG TPA: polysaccharide biosynthesis/export family protein [Bacteroidales bacterium]
MKKSLRVFKPILWLFLFSLVLSSCVPMKKILYLQVKGSADTLSNFINERKIDYRIQPGDNLYIRVVTLDEKTTQMLNPLAGSLNTSNIGGSDANIYLTSYTVNEAGYLNFPLVGEIFVRNMNVDEIRDAIQEELKVYLKELVVVVKLVNYNLTLLGEVNRQGQYKVYQTDINLFEAAALAGGLTDFANRNKIAVIRLTKTGSAVHYVDMTRKDILSSDYYYLKPNDIVYVPPVKGKQFGFATFPYVIILSTITTTILLLNYFQTN